MTDRSAIEQLFADYAWPLDTLEWSEFGNLFTEDASFKITIADGTEIGPLNGRDTIVEFCHNAASGQTDQRRHLITNFRVHSISETEASTTAILTLIVIEDKQLDVKSSGIYRARVVKEPDGRWRFRELCIDLDLAF